MGARCLSIFIGEAAASDLCGNKRHDSDLVDRMLIPVDVLVAENNQLARYLQVVGRHAKRFSRQGTKFSLGGFSKRGPSEVGRVRYRVTS